MRQYKSLFKENILEDSNIKLTPFTKMDWRAYAGAAKLNDGSGPFVGSLTIISDNVPLEAEIVVASNIDIERDEISGSNEQIIISIPDLYDNNGTYVHYGIEVLPKLKPTMTVEELQNLDFELL